MNSITERWVRTCRREVALAEISSALVVAGVRDVDRGRSRWHPHVAVDQRGMMIDRAAATGLPGRDERIRLA
ncbi:hypothetical protein ACFU6I_46275, partial [Streptomyces sp. NPDC057486]|uniref:hypothetical protein n=1 Tax=Streptomyces sp. NPDC057486 TaxID=3346145 RepID=UPI0036C25AF7